MAITFDGAPLQVLNAAEEFRQVLNLLRTLDLRDESRERLAARSRLLSERLRSFGIDSNHLLHDREWARRPVAGATFSSLGSESQPRRKNFPD